MFCLCSLKYTNNLCLSTPKKPTTQWKNEQKTWIVISPKKIYRWPTSTWKKAQHHWLLEKCKSKLLWSTTSHQSEWPSLLSPQITNAGESVEKREHSYPSGRNVNWYKHYGNRWKYLRKLNIELPYDLAIPLLGIELDKTFSEKDTCTGIYVHCSSIHSSQDMEKT